MANRFAVSLFGGVAVRPLGRLVTQATWAQTQEPRSRRSVTAAATAISNHRHAQRVTQGRHAASNSCSVMPAAIAALSASLSSAPKTQGRFINPPSDSHDSSDDAPIPVLYRTAGIQLLAVETLDTRLDRNLEEAKHDDRFVDLTVLNDSDGAADAADAELHPEPHFDPPCGHPLATVRAGQLPAASVAPSPRRGKLKRRRVVESSDSGGSDGSAGSAGPAAQIVLRSSSESDD